MVWKAIAGSAIGTRHQQKQVPCQDYGNYIIADSLMIGAIADGAGSAKHADVGARLAVETALSELAACRWLQEIDQISESEARTLFTEVFVKVITVLQAQALDAGYPLEELACTLLIFVTTPDWIAAMQIGDGFIVVGDPQEGTYQLLFQPDKGEFINETMFVTVETVLDQMQVYAASGEIPPFVCAATDGLEKVAIRMRDWVPYPPFFQPFVEGLKTVMETTELQTHLQDFLESDRLNARTNDDKTLLLCLYDQGSS